MSLGKSAMPVTIVRQALKQQLQSVCPLLRETCAVKDIIAMLVLQFRSHAHLVWPAQLRECHSLMLKLSSVMKDITAEEELPLKLL